MNFLKRTGSTCVIAFVMGVLMAMQYYVPHKPHRICLRCVSDGTGLLGVRRVYRPVSSPLDEDCKKGGRLGIQRLFLFAGLYYPDLWLFEWWKILLGMTSSKIPCLTGCIIMYRVPAAPLFFYFSLFYCLRSLSYISTPYNRINRVAHCGYPRYAWKGVPIGNYISQYILDTDWIMLSS